MARRFGADAYKTEVAALFHDCCKDSSQPGNNLAHAGLAADLMKDEYGCTDEDVLNAVRYHTTGRAGMSRLELIIFLADTLEPGRTYGGVGELREECLKDLHRGALTVLIELEKYLNKEGLEASKDTKEAIMWLTQSVIASEAKQSSASKFR
jgi:predicted HD superfamily hydrolase involved in NAD metabolism